MPWMIVKNGDQFCVHKQNADGSAGDNVKCHPTEQEAKDHMAAMYASMPEAAVKAIGDLKLEVLGVPFGGPNNGKDLAGEYFDETTNIYKDAYPEIPVNYFHSLDKYGKPTGVPNYIGKAKYLRTDSRGHWYEVVLDKTKELALKVWDAAMKGFAAASSETLDHLASKDRKTGHIVHWPVVGMAVLDVKDGRHPVNSFAIATPSMKAIYRDAGLPFPEIGNPPQNNLSKAELAARSKRIAKVLADSKRILPKK